MFDWFSPRGGRGRRLPVALLGVALLAVVVGTMWTAAASLPLVVTISDSVTTVVPGERLTYRVAITNARASGDVTVAQASSALSANTLFRNASDGGTYDNLTHSVTWTLGPDVLVPGDSAYRYVTVDVKPGLVVGTSISTAGAAVEQGNPTPYSASPDVDTVTNVPPDAADASRSTPEDTALSLDLATFTTDPNGDTLAFGIQSGTTHGTLNLVGSSVTYTPGLNYSGPDAFTFTVGDGQGGSDTATVSLTVTPVNDPPTPGPDSGSTLEDTALVVPAATLLTNDSDVDGGALTVSGVQPTSANGGTVTLSGGNITYQPAANFNGTDTVTYIVDDGNPGGTANGTLTVTVTAVNDAPTITLGANPSVAEDAAAQSLAGWATAITAGPADESGQTLTIVGWTNSNPGLFAAQPSLSLGGTLAYTPAANASGSATITFALQDNGGTANGGVDTTATLSFTITVSPAPDAPIANNDTVTTPSGTPLQVQVLSNDSDADGNALTVIAVTQPANGSVAIDVPATTVTFTPAPAFEGSTSFTYTIDDGTGRQATATVFVTVTHVNARPVVYNHSYTTNEDVQLIVADAQGTLSDATDADLDGLSFVLVAGPSHGQLSWYAGGGFSYYPAANYNGPDSFTFRASDGTTTSDIGTVSLTVNAVNDVPSLSGTGNVSVVEDAPAYSAAWFSNQSPGPADEAAQTVTRTVSNNNTALFTVQPALADDGTLSFTTAANASGSATVTVLLQDTGGTANGGGNQRSYSFTITVRPVNDAPTFVSGGDITVAEDSPAFSAPWAGSISVGPANESAQAPSFQLWTASSALFTVQPAVSAGGVLTFTPAPNANGVAVVSATLYDDGGTADGGQNLNSQSFTITITPVNDPPVAGPDTITVLKDRTTTIAVATLLRNDSDPDGDTLSITDVTIASANGGIVGFRNGAIVYTPPAGFVGTVSFTYTLADGTGNTATGTVTVKVSPLYFSYLPLVGVASAAAPAPAPLLAPDLVGTFALSPAQTSFTAGQPVAITATITNRGTGPADAFWVDLYMNPAVAPTTSNIAWNTTCSLTPCQGLAWYVSGGLLPGQTVTLTSAAGSFMSSYSIWSGAFTPGTTDLYLYVDSWNPNVVSGGVAESDETNNRAELHALSVGGAAAQGLDLPDAAALPQRPSAQSK